ncbi:MAG TPA: hypothetical protein VMW50_10255 [Dehalococcoidia bacterium]|nr:hypothetical protein [Dehalococcoidia bacterium]
MKYTEGEWKVIRGAAFVKEKHIFAGKEHIATVFGENNTANANLMAASKDLYDELVEADETICQLCKRLNPQHENCTSCGERENRRKAIAKTESNRAEEMEKEEGKGVING